MVYLGSSQDSEGLAAVSFSYREASPLASCLLHKTPGYFYIKLLCEILS